MIFSKKEEDLYNPVKDSVNGTQGTVQIPVRKEDLKYPSEK